jgi:hypothetical protein
MIPLRKDSTAMPTRKHSSSKAKATARSNAAERANNVPKIGGKSPRTGTSERQRSQSRFPGETPLTGEDRPATRPGNKSQGRPAKPRPS